MSTKLAIIGMAGRFPACRSVDDLWSLVSQGREATIWRSDEELLSVGVPLAELEHPDYVRATLTVPGFDTFDAGFFGLSPRDAALMSPQHRHFLQCCHLALEETGWSPARFRGAIGVFGGCGYESYFAQHVLRNSKIMDETGFFLARHTGNDKDFLTTRVSYLLGLSGPSVGVQTACSTSLVAIHMAAQSLLSGECDMALAGGATIELPQGRGYRYVPNEILSKDGHCRAFDDAATGTIFGSGVGIVALRRLEDALADGDPIRAVILGTAVNNDGASKAGYLAPSVSGQANAAAEALAVAGIEGHDIDYIEAHGTGTVVGDPIELTALAQAYGLQTGRGRIGIGSLKSNIGHLDTAAGVASLIKSVLALEHDQMPASLNCLRPNSRFNLAQSPFRVVTTMEPWRRSARPRRIAVNSLGVGGTNAHAIVEEAPMRLRTKRCEAPRLIFMSAKSAPALDRVRETWRCFAQTADQPSSVADAAYTSREARTAFEHREVAVAGTFAGLAKALSSEPRVKNTAASRPSIVFMYPGGGAQYPGAAASLYRGERVFRTAADEALAALPPDLMVTLAQSLFSTTRDDEKARRLLQRPLASVLSVFVIEVALTALWRHWGVTPTAVVGHSAGDYAAAVAAGVMTLQNAVSCLLLRGRIFERLPPGGMVVVSADEATTCAVSGPDLDIAAVNGPELTVVSGPRADLDALMERLANRNLVGRRVPIDVAAHSRAIEPYLPEYRALLSSIRLESPRVPFYSGLAGALPVDITTADYWVRHLRETVRFGEALNRVLEAPDTILLEVGPGQALCGIARSSTWMHPPKAVVPSIPHVEEAQDDLAFARLQCGRLWTAGVDVDLTALRDAEPCSRVRIPGYPLAEDRHWIDPDASLLSRKTSDDAGSASIARLADASTWVSRLTWQARERSAVTSGGKVRTLLIADDSPLATALARALPKHGDPLLIATAEHGSIGARSAGLDVRLDDLLDVERFVDALLAHPERIERLVLVATPRDATPQARAHSAFRATTNLFKALQTRDWDTPLDVRVVTTDAWALAAGPAHSPEHAVVIGPCRVVGRETPMISARVIDVASAEISTPGSLGLVVAETTSEAGPDLVLLRAGQRYVESTVTAPTTGRSRIKPGGAYLITGAAGGIAGLLAKHLATAHQARLALVSRRHLPEASIAALRKAGADVLSLVADVTDETEMRAAVDAARHAFGRIDGVFHLAAKLDDSPMAHKSDAASAAVLAPKIDGAFVLDRLFPAGSVDLFVLFSSVSAILGPPGQADYAAANAVLDAIAARRPDGCAINWGIWRDIGLTAPVPPSSSDHIVHPLLGRMDESAKDRVSFSALLSREDLWALCEHRVAGRAVLPGTAYLEMARAAIDAAAGLKSVDLRSVNFLAPLLFDEGEKRVVQTTLTLEDQATWSFVVESRSGHGGTVSRHFAAQVSAGEPTPRRRVPNLSVATFGLRREQSRLAQAQGHLLGLGPRFDVLASLAVTSETVRGSVRLQDVYLSDLNDYKAHPALVDIAMTIGLFGLPKADRWLRLHVPLSVRAIHGLQALPSRFWVTSRRQPAPEGLQNYDVTFSSASGAILTVFEGLSLKALDAGAFTSPPVTGPDHSLADIVAAGWTEADAPALFDHVLTIDARRLVASSVSLPALRARQQAMAPRLKPRAAKAGVSSTAPRYANAVERRVAEMCADVLGLDQVAPEEDFFALGGQSLVAVRLFARFRKEWNADLPLATLFEMRTIRALAERIVTEIGPPVVPSSQDRAVNSGKPDTAQRSASWTPLVCINPGEAGAPALVYIHGAGGNVFAAKPLADGIGTEVPFFGLQAFGVDGRRKPLDSIPDMARAYLAAIRDTSPQLPRCLIGYSGGGVIALEMARQLREEGRTVDLIVMIDTLAPTQGKIPSRLGDWVRYGRDQGVRRLSEQINQSMREKLRGRGLIAPEQVPSDVQEARGVLIFQKYLQAQSRYVVEPIATDVLLFRAKYGTVKYHRAGSALGWQDLILGRLDTVDLDVTHESIVAPTITREIAGHIRSRLSAISTVAKHSQPETVS